MATFFRCTWYDESATSPATPGHPLYVSPRQGAGRVDDPLHEYRVLYVCAEPDGCVAEAWGDFALWTPALLAAPPNLPGAVRAIVEYDVAATICDLDDPKRLVALGLRPSHVVSGDRRATQGWARRIYETGRFDGVAWWSRRDARWTSVGLWHHEGVTPRSVTVLTDLTAEPVVEAAGVLLRRIGA